MSRTLGLDAAPSRRRACRAATDPSATRARTSTTRRLTLTLRDRDPDVSAQYSVPVGKPPSWPACQVPLFALVTAVPPPTVAYSASGLVLLFFPPLTAEYLPPAVFRYPPAMDEKYALAW